MIPAVLVCAFFALLASVSIADPTSNIPTLPRDFLELDDYLENQTLVYDNLGGGVWRQGWDVTYDDSQWSEENPLNVFVLLHSHNDPGWIKTFEAYFQEQTKGIINSVVNSLSQDPARRFIWAEISFFARWWDTADQTMRDKAKKVILNKQLEIVTGGWVMNDEATVHYLATINQLTMGHIWLEQNIGVVPKHGWAIDPFGHSPTMASLLNQAGFQAAIINRVHFYLKKVLAWHQFLEFRWQQQWDEDDEFLVHMFPFFSYDIPHTCGPEPKICAMLDFARIGSGTSWGDPIVAITDSNLELRASQAVDQYKKKASLYRTGNNVLIPMGEDFKYVSQESIDSMTSNMDRIFAHVNGNRAKFKTNIRYGTLADYFESVASSAAKQTSEANSDKFFPALKGDFFVYDDVDEDYWSGYYTSRPYWKNLDRQMEAAMRSAEIILAWARGRYPSDLLSLFDEEGHCNKLIEARKLWSIFQHHDGMTGTAARHVVVDYGGMLHTALSNAKKVMQSLIPVLMSKPGEYATFLLDSNEVQDQANKFASIKVLEISEGSEIALVVYNSLARPRNEVLMIHVDSPYIEIVTADNKPVPFQIAPIVNFASLGLESGKYRVYFKVSLPSITTSTLFLRYSSSLNADAVPSITALRLDDWPTTFLEKEISDDATFVKISSNAFDLEFDHSTGMMTTATIKKSKHGTLDLKEDFMQYSSLNAGAYLFRPTGQATTICGKNHSIIIIQGPLVSEVITKLPETVTRAVRLYNIEDKTDLRYIEVESRVDLQASNRDIINRFTVPSIDTEGAFFTDLNGFSFRKRFITKKQPIQANFYPITETAFIQDSKLRFSVNTRQPLGAGALDSSVLELVLDRRTSTDDGRGLQQPVDDNLPMMITFHLTLEEAPSPAPNVVESRAVARSLKGLDRALKFNNPVIILSTPIKQSTWMKTLHFQSSLLEESSPLLSLPDAHLLSFKLRDTSDIGRENDTIIQVMRYLHDVTDGERMKVIPYTASKLGEEFKGVSITSVSRRSLTTVLDALDEEDIAVQRVHTWIAHFVPFDSSKSVATPSPTSTITLPPSSRSSPSPSSRSSPSPPSTRSSLPPRPPSPSTSPPSSFSGFRFYWVSFIIFVVSAILVVYTATRKSSAFRWIALVIIVFNFAHVLIATHTLNDVYF